MAATKASKAATKTRKELHHLVDQLPEDELHAAQRYLEFLAKERAADRFYQMLQSAPIDDEPETPEEAAAVAEAKAEFAAGKLLTHEEVQRHLLENS